ncbi:Photosystem I reaction center subunit III, chloroplastic [Triticum urartu]|uniref:Photosystem I reaction center subunit III n=1 Tax=Triticum urartu TaxID=4572 RepID=M7YQ78_TRIUA|nr:Photosystem I reaction center subunit III, chloroplastic [Triticum urartu]
MRTRMPSSGGGAVPASPASLSPLAAISNASSHAYAHPGCHLLRRDVVDTVANKYGWDPDMEVPVWPLNTEGALVGATQCRPDAPAVEEVVWPDVVDFVAGDGALEFGTGVRDMDIVGPFELVVCDGAGGGLAELQLPSSKAFAKREKQSVKKLNSSLKKYAPDSAPALAIQATIEKTKRRFENYGKFGLLCGSDGLPHLIVSGDQRHWGEFITPGVLFLYIAGWIGWVGRSYLIAVSGEKKPAMREIIIDVELAARIIPRGFIWPVAAYRELINGDLVVDDADIGY